MNMITIHIGKALTSLIQDGRKRLHFQHQLNFVRQRLFQEFESFPPNYTIKYHDKLASTHYSFTLEGFGKITYEAEQWDVRKQEEELFERIVFHYERFLRKWYMNAPDLTVEDKLKNQPLVIEYGENWGDLLEDDGFFHQLKTLLTTHSIELEEPPYWESDYVGSDQLVVYVRGKDHYVKSLQEKTSDMLLEKVIQPILRENYLRLKHF